MRHVSDIMGYCQRLKNGTSWYLSGICCLPVLRDLSFARGGGDSVKCWVRECHWETETHQRDIPIQLILLEYEPWALKCFAFVSLDR